MCREAGTYQSKDAELTAENPEEASDLASGRELPLDGELAELTQCRGIQHGQEACTVLLLTVCVSVSAVSGGAG